MRLFGLVVALCLIATNIAGAESTAVRFFRGRGQVSSLFSTLLSSRTHRYFAVVSEKYFAAPWDLYEQTGGGVQALRSGSSWLLGVLNDGSTIEYFETEVGEFGQVGQFSCVVTKVNPNAESTTLLSFPWPPAPELAPSSELSADVVSGCPELKVSPESAGQLLLAVPPLFYSGLRNERYISQPATAEEVYHLDTSSAGTLTLITRISAEDLRAISRGDSNYLESQFWLSPNGFSLTTIRAQSKEIGVLASGSTILGSFVLSRPARLVGLTEDGLPLLRRGNELFSRNADGSLDAQGRYTPNSSDHGSIYDNYDSLGIFPEFDSFRSQRYVLLGGNRGLNADANCHLPLSLGWRITHVIGTLGKRTAIVRMESGRAVRLAVVNVPAIKNLPLSCQASIRTDVLGPSECQSRMKREAYGERIQSSEYESLPSNLRCGFQVTLTDAQGQRVSGAAVQFQSSRYGSRVTQIALTQTTDNNGQTTFWVDITQPSRSGSPAEIGPAYIVSPVGSSRFHELGVLVYDRYSHV